MADSLGAWDIVDNLLKRIHKDVMTLKFPYKSEVYPKATEMWPGLDNETYLKRVMKELVTNPNLLLPVPSAKQMKAFTNLRIDARKSGRGSTISDATKKLGADTSADVLSHSNPYTTVMSPLKDMVKGNPTNLRPITWFALHIACLLPFIFLTTLVQSWVNAFEDMETQGDMELFLKLMEGMDDMLSIPWCKVTADFVRSTVTLPTTDSMTPDEITKEWTKVRQLIKLLVITMGPQTR